MEMEDFEYLNMLSKKAIKDTLTCTELNEFKRLLKLWNDNLFQRSHTANTTDQYFNLCAYTVYKKDTKVQFQDKTNGRELRG